MIATNPNQPEQKLDQPAVPRQRESRSADYNRLLRRSFGSSFLIGARSILTMNDHPHMHRSPESSYLIATFISRSSAASMLPSLIFGSTAKSNSSRTVKTATPATLTSQWIKGPIRG